MLTVRILYAPMLVAMLMATTSTPVRAEAPAPARNAITVVASPLQVNFTKAASERLTRRLGLPPLEITPLLASPAVKAFCAGPGPETPDVLALPRRMAKHEATHCADNDVGDMIELSIGFDALVLAVRKGDAVFNLTPRAMYFALAADVPLDDDFVHNTTKRWNDVDPRLPAIDINVMGSVNDTAITAFFKEIFLEGGCRGLRQFKVYYSAIDRVKTCTTIRSDGHYVGIKPPIAVNFKDAFKAAPPGTVGVLPYTVYRLNADWLDLLPVSGVLPTPSTIKDDEYEAVSPVRYYVKRRHMERSLGGDGVVRGLYNFIEEIMSEDAIGNGGYLEALGLVVDDPADRKTDRDTAQRLQPFRR